MLTHKQLQEKASEAGVQGLQSLDPMVYCEDCGREFDIDWEYRRNQISKQPIAVNRCKGCGHLQIVEVGDNEVEGSRVINLKEGNKNG